MAQSGKVTKPAHRTRRKGPTNSYPFRNTPKVKKAIQRGTPEGSDDTNYGESSDTDSDLDLDVMEWSGHTIHGYNQTPAVKVTLDEPGKINLQVDLQQYNTVQKAHDMYTKRARTRSNRKVTDAGFLKLPYEVRLLIYRAVFRRRDPINFDTRDNMERSASLLRTNSTIHDEGTEILYGENSFHFERVLEKRGTLWQREWKEIGYKDARRFFRMIGTENLGLLRYVSIVLEDATLGSRPGSELEQRRYVNDPIVISMLRLLGEHTRLDVLSVCFAGRAYVLKSDYHFLKALATIRCKELQHANPLRQLRSKIGQDILEKLQTVMQVPGQENQESQERSGYKVIMIKEWLQSRGWY